MATVDHGVIVRSDSTWIIVRPKCPKCGHVGNDWNEIHIGKPQHQFDKRTNACGCTKCGNRFVITAYYG